MNFWQMCSFHTSMGTALMHLVEEKIGATVLRKKYGVLRLLFFCRLAGGAADDAGGAEDDGPPDAGGAEDGPDIFLIIEISQKLEIYDMRPLNRKNQRDFAGRTKPPTLKHFYPFTTVVFM